MKFPTIIALFVATVVSGVAANNPRVDNAIATIRRNADALSKSVREFPVGGGGTVVQAKNIGNDAANLQNSLDQGTKEVHATPPFSDADGHRYYEQIKAHTTTVVGCLHDLIARKKSFENVQGVNAVRIVADGLGRLGSSASAFGDAMIKSDPDSVKPQARDLKEHMAVEFRECERVYSK